MAVLRIVPNILAEEPARARFFYEQIIGLRVVMDMGWIVTLAAEAVAVPQLSLASEGGGGAPLPDISIEVDDLAAVLARAQAAGLVPEYGPVSEPWGVTRFFLRDPCGRLVNILAHG